MIALRALAFLPYVVVVFVIAMLVLIVYDEDRAGEFTDAAHALWREWR